MKTDNQLDKLIAEYKQDRGKHPIKQMLGLSEEDASAIVEGIKDKLAS